MPNPPADPILMERAMAQAIVTFVEQVDHVGHVYSEPQFFSTPEEADAGNKVDDPVAGANFRLTNIIEVGLPTIEETSAVGGGSDEEFTGLILTYPISFKLGVVPKWEKSGFPFTSSAQMAMGIYLKARNLFKRDRTLGFGTNKVTHFYLQLVWNGEVENDQGEVLYFAQEWELTIQVEGIY